jgi:hypothetical protein
MIHHPDASARADSVSCDFWWIVPQITPPQYFFLLNSSGFLQLQSAGCSCFNTDNCIFNPLSPGIQALKEANSDYKPEVWRPGQLLQSSGDSGPPGSGEGPAHPATRRGPKAMTPAEDEPSAPTDKTSTTASGPDSEEPWSLPDDQALGGKPSATAARGQGL